MESHEAVRSLVATARQETLPEAFMFGFIGPYMETPSETNNFYKKAAKE